MKDKKLRGMILDCLIRYKEIYGHKYNRPTKSVDVHTFELTHIYGEPSLKDILSVCDGDISKIYVKEIVTQDWDGYPENSLRVYKFEKVSDEEYFDEISNVLSPEYDYKRYNQYFKLKEEFGE